jgi:NitT/TauT family transport system ATP-binding protein
MSFIQVKNVWQEYGDQVVLERLNLIVREGEFCTLVGASGCGKSTFLRLLLGQERPSKGEILLAGQPLVAEPDASRGVVFQRYSVFPHLSVLDNVAIGLELPRSPLLGRLFGNAKREARERAAELLRKVGLGHALNKYPSALSGGMQQRLAIAQALIMKPRVLLLDEPFGALDAITRDELQRWLLDIWQLNGWSILLITHDIEEAVFLATDLVLLEPNPGRIAERLHDAKLRIADAECAVIDRTKAAARATDDYVNDNPWRAVGIAAGVGLLLGIIIGRR